MGWKTFVVFTKMTYASIANFSSHFWQSLLVATARPRFFLFIAPVLVMPLRIPYSWLETYVSPLPPPDELAERLTTAGLEVETIERIGADWDQDKLVVGEILSVSKHPQADRLCLVEVSSGKGKQLTIVTGATNIMSLMNTKPVGGASLGKAPLALSGARLIDPYSATAEKKPLQPSRIRGILSEGMLCSEKELGLGNEHEGILLLPPETKVGTPLTDVYGDTVLVFDIKGSFGHLLSVQGVAREAKAILGTIDKSAEKLVKSKSKTYTEQHIDEQISSLSAPSFFSSIANCTSFLELSIKDPQWCSRYSAVLIEGIQMDNSPIWMQKRLQAAGMRPINAVVDATNYVLLSRGQPLHAFDFNRLRGKQAQAIVTVRRAKPREKIQTLDNQSHLLDEQMLLIADAKKPLAIAGVMGGKETEIQPDTTDVLLEAANFDFLNIRRTSQMLKIRSESADLFGKRVDAEQTLVAALECAQLITQHCGGHIHSQAADIYTSPKKSVAIELSLEWLERLLGKRIPTAEIKRILTALGLKVTGNDPLSVIPPSFRQDISQPADLAEEIARIHGYNHFTPTRMTSPIPPPRDNQPLRCQEHIRDILAASGLNEIITYSLTSPQDEQKLQNSSPPSTSFSYLGLKKPQTPERTHLRQTLLPSMIRTVAENLRFLPSVAVFELGKVFALPVPQKTSLPMESLRLTAALCGLRNQPYWQNIDHNSSDNFDFYDLKGITETLLTALHIESVTFRTEIASLHAGFHPGRQAEIWANNRSLGYIGELHPSAAIAFQLGGPSVNLLDLNAQTLIDMWQENHRAQPISPHPPIYEDLAFVADTSLAAEEIRQQIIKAGAPLLKNVQLFDYWEGDTLPKGKKSLTYALIYQSPERTLSDKEVAKIRANIIGKLEQMGAVLR